MGMSASQMRFLQLTQRKSDVEYQGQQINQARTTLASESAALNNKLLGMTVPVPPSSGSYVRTTYSFTSNGETNTITSTDFNAAPGNYTINYTYNTTTTRGENTGLATFANTAAAGDPPRYVTTAGTELNAATTAEDLTNIQMLIADCGLDPAAVFLKYGTGQDTKYVLANQVAQTANTGVAISTYGINYQAAEAQQATLTNAEISWSDSGRMQSITTADGRQFNLTVNTVSDEVAYDSAMNEYEYQKSLYQNIINEINAKLEIIQGQDKNLELKLKDCDTQHNAVQTELDAVQKVIQKNVESTFKIFG